jgi:glutathione synthase/RimK-type ligase-like ATP-grasp enzyme
MPDVRLVTASVLPVPDPDLDRLATALGGRGVSVERAPWDDVDVDWSDARCTVLRSPWDYVDRLDEFLAWIDAAGARTSVWNPPALVRWNTHKAYLLELASAGAPVVPTVLLPRGSAASLDGIADARGWDAMVVKPAVGIGGHGAARVEVGDAHGQDHLDALLAGGDTLVQPYAHAIERDGELSIVLVDARATHAVRKTPAAGDFRIHEHHGGRLVADDLGRAPVGLAERVAGILPAPALYARVDLVRFGTDWHVLEVEVTEPRLYLEHAPPDATESLVDAVITRLDGRAP